MTRAHLFFVASERGLNQASSRVCVFRHAPLTQVALGKTGAGSDNVTLHHYASNCPCLREGASHTSAFPLGQDAVEGFDKPQHSTAQHSTAQCSTCNSRVIHSPCRCHDLDDHGHGGEIYHATPSPPPVDLRPWLHIVQAPQSSDSIRPCFVNVHTITPTRREALTPATRVTTK